MLLYHPMHDMFKVHSELTTVVFLSLYAVIVFIADRHNRNPEARPRPGQFCALSLRMGSF
jgi:hypothetical protein